MFHETKNRSRALSTQETHTTNLEEEIQAYCRTQVVQTLRQKAPLALDPAPHPEGQYPYKPKRGRSTQPRVRGSGLRAYAQSGKVSQERCGTLVLVQC